MHFADANNWENAALMLLPTITVFLAVFVVHFCVVTMNERSNLMNTEEDENTEPCLFPFAGNPRQEMPDGIPFRLMDYLELVD